MILSKRHGEHPEVLAAREAWLDDGNLDRALELMPRRVIAERCILESYQKQKGETRNAMGALSTVSKPSRVQVYPLYSSLFILDTQKPPSHVHPCLSVLRLEFNRL